MCSSDPTGRATLKDHYAVALASYCKREDILRCHREATTQQRRPGEPLNLATSRHEQAVRAAASVGCPLAPGGGGGEARGLPPLGWKGRRGGKLREGRADVNTVWSSEVTLRSTSDFAGSIPSKRCFAPVAAHHDMTACLCHGVSLFIGRPG